MKTVVVSAEPVSDVADGQRATWRLGGSADTWVGAAPAPDFFTPLLEALESCGAEAVVVRGAGLAREALLCAWRGWPTAWCLPPGKPPDLVGGLAWVHAAAVLDPGPADEDDDGLAARAAAAISGRGLRADPDLPPRGIPAWRRLQEQLAMREALAAGDGARHRAIVREIVSRETGRGPQRARSARWGGGASVEPPASGEPRERTLLVLTHEYSLSGAPFVLARVLRGLMDRGSRWRVHVLGRSDGPLRGMFESMRIPASLYAPEDPEGFLDAVGRIAPDLVVANTVTMYAEVLLLEWKGVPVQWWLHEGLSLPRSDGYALASPDLTAVLRTALGAVSGVLVGSEDTRHEYELFCPGLARRSGYVPNPIPLDELDAVRRSFGPGERAAVRRDLGVGADDVLFVCIGGIETRKNHLRLVSAFQRFLEALPDEARPCRLLMLGRPLRERGSENLREEILDAIAPRHRDSITLVGNRDSVFPVLLAADAHVLVSTTESSPLINLEAAALGVPCISSAVHGIPEVLPDGERGFLADPRDVDAIARTLRRVHDLIVSQAPELEGVRARARSFVRARHDHRRSATDFAEHLEKAAASTQPGSIARGAQADKLLAENLTLLWSVFKADVAVERHLVRAHAHRGFLHPEPLRCLERDPMGVEPGSEPPRALVTGGCGLIGGPVVAGLLARGARVLVVDDLSSGDPAALPSSERLELVRGDLADAGVLARISAFRAATVFHFAARSFIPACELDPVETRRVNVDATRRLLEAVRAHPPHDVVYASSGAVYEPSERPHREDDRLGPIDAYGHTKLAGENLVLELCARMGSCAVVARIFNTYGPRSKHPYVIQSLARQLRSGVRTLRVGDVDAVRDFSFVEDVAEALLLLPSIARRDGMVVNVGAGGRHSVGDAVAAFSALLREPLQLVVDPSLIRASDRRTLLCDPTLLKRLTAWTPRHDLAAGLAKVLTARE